MRAAGPHFAGILGWPLGHTLSPTLHNAAFRALDLDWVYLSWPVAPADLPAAVGGLRALGAAGANVTMPHKQAVVPLLDDLSGDARATGAVNTVARVGEMLVGHNTDVDGFANFLTSDVGAEVTGRRALVLGAGGAARAVVRALDVLGAAEITVAARSEAAASAAVGVAAQATGIARSWEGREELATAADVVVNATSIGMRGGGDPAGSPLARLREGQIVIDLVYDPAETALVTAARSAGAAAWGGLGMLVGQAAGAFRIWTGQEPPVEVMSAVALRSLTTRDSLP